MRYLFILLLFSVFYSCSPQLHYLGDAYPPTTYVDTYYSEDDISEQYKVIGQLTGTNETNSINNLDDVKNAMIVEAKKRGANGILFLFADSLGNNHNVKAVLIKYLK